MPCDYNDCTRTASLGESATQHRMMTPKCAPLYLNILVDFHFGAQFYEFGIKLVLVDKAKQGPQVYSPGKARSLQFSIRRPR